MNRLFSRFFIFILLAVSAASLLMYSFILTFYGDPLEEIALKQASAQIFLIEHYIDQAANDEWLVRLNKAREVSSLKVEIIQLKTALSKLSEAKQRGLLSGAIELNIADKSFMRRVDLRGERYVGSAEDVMLVQNLPIDIHQAVFFEFIRFCLISLCLLIPIGFWSSRHWAGLLELSAIAQEFGQGKFERRTLIHPSGIIAPLAECMNQMASRIANLLETQKNLMHAVSHELRTPIARLEFGLTLLRKAAKNPELSSRFEHLENDLSELNQLVSELLDIAKMQGMQQLALKPCSLTEILQHCQTAQQHLLINRQLFLNVQNAPATIVADQTLLTRACNNLLANAAKYSQSSIWISSEHCTDHYSVTIEDDGPGIPEEQWEQVFQAFYRLDRSRERSSGGFGLGLAIVQQVIHMHQGKIEIAHSEHGGLKLTLCLPLTMIA